MKGYLLVNLGTPANLSVKAVRQYLREFLMDEYVIDINPVARFLLVHCIIAPFRSPKSLAAYQQIWLPEGSPLLVNSQNLIVKLAKRIQSPVRLAMRYGSPSIESVLRELHQKGVTELVVLPLYPQYAESSSRSSIEKVRSIVAKKKFEMKLTFIPEFYNFTGFIDTWVQKIKQECLKQNYDHILFSYHGLPEHHMQKIDATKQHCLIKQDCCASISTDNIKCYRAQAFATTALIAQKFNWDPSYFSTAFQFRLGRREWIKPYTDVVLENLGKQGIKKLLVVSPSFVADCLETIEEIGIRGRDSFKENGGEVLQLLDSLNDDEAWVNCVEQLLTQSL